MLLRRVLFTTGLIGLMVVLVVVGGWPDPGGSVDFLTGRNVTATTESAFLVLLCWGGIAALTLLTAIGPARNVRRGRTDPTRRTRARSLAILGLGLTLLGMGIAHQLSGYRVCCADQVTAHQAEQLVH